MPEMPMINGWFLLLAVIGMASAVFSAMLASHSSRRWKRIAEDWERLCERLEKEAHGLRFAQVSIVEVVEDEARAYEARTGNDLRAAYLRTTLLPRIMRVIADA